MQLPESPSELSGRFSTTSFVAASTLASGGTKLPFDEQRATTARPMNPTRIGAACRIIAAYAS